MTDVVDGSSRGDINAHRRSETVDGLQKAVTPQSRTERNKNIFVTILDIRTI